jgi:hypothetical protein
VNRRRRLRLTSDNNRFDTKYSFGKNYENFPGLALAWTPGYGRRLAGISVARAIGRFAASIPGFGPADLDGHLTVAPRYEGLDPRVRKALFQAASPQPLEAIVRATPTGRYARRAGFLYEWRLGTALDAACWIASLCLAMTACGSI